jgi:hypothetical protein
MPEHEFDRGCHEHHDVAGVRKVVGSNDRSSTWSGWTTVRKFAVNSGVTPSAGAMAVVAFAIVSTTRMRQRGVSG